MTDTGVPLDQLEAVDLAIAAVREGGAWDVVDLADAVLSDIGTIVDALTELGDDVLAMLAVDEDFFVLVRCAHEVRVLLSDVTAVGEWDLADAAADHLGIEPDDDADREPAGDLHLLEDLGVPAADLAVLLEDIELYPDEICSHLAVRLGFGESFDEVVGLTSA